MNKKIKGLLIATMLLISPSLYSADSESSIDFQMKTAFQNMYTSFRNMDPKSTKVVASIKLEESDCLGLDEDGNDNLCGVTPEESGVSYIRRIEQGYYHAKMSPAMKDSNYGIALTGSKSRTFGNSTLSIEIDEDTKTPTDLYFRCTSLLDGVSSPTDCGEGTLIISGELNDAAILLEDVNLNTAIFDLIENIQTISEEKSKDVVNQATSDIVSKAKDEALGDVSELLSGYAKVEDIPTAPDLSGYALTSQLPDLSGYAKSSEIPSLVGYAKTSDIPSLSGYALKTEIPSISGLATTESVTEAKNLANEAITAVSSIKAVDGECQTHYEMAGIKNGEVICREKYKASGVIVTSSSNNPIIYDDYGIDKVVMQSWDVTYVYLKESIDRFSRVQITPEFKRGGTGAVTASYHILNDNAIAVYITDINGKVLSDYNYSLEVK